MTLSETPPSQTPPNLGRTRPSRAQRRRAQRRAMPSSVEGRSTLLKNLVQRAYPSYEFFLFAAFCGAILGAGYILDSQAFLIFGILMAPLMTPFVGMTLATVSGTAGFFFKTLGAFIVGSLLIFGTGALAGLAARIWLPLTLTQAFEHSRLWWPDLVVLALGAILLTASFVRSEKKPFLPSVMVAYELFLPLNAAAFGLASGVGDIWPEGFFVFLVHLAWAMLFGALTLFFLGFRPFRAAGWIFSIIIVFLLIGVSGGLMLTGTKQTFTDGILPTSTREAVLATETDTSAAAVIPTETSASPASSTPKSVSNATPSRTLTPKITLLPTLTPTTTLTPQATPVYARIHAKSGGGAYVRREPGGPVILTLDNNELVQVLTEAVEYEGAPWVQVKIIRDTQTFEGWLIQSVLQTATPAPEW